MLEVLCRGHAIVRHEGYVRLAWWYRLMHWLYYVGAAVAIVILLNVVLVLYLAIAGRDGE